MSIGIRSFVTGPRVYFIDRAGLADPVAGRLALSETREARPGHEKHLNDDWLRGRFAARAADEPAEVEVVRQALRCGDLAAYLDAVRAPLTASRFIDNLGGALRFHSLRVPRDPWDAHARFCGGEDAFLIEHAGGDGGRVARRACPGFAPVSHLRVSLNQGAVASIDVHCEGLRNPLRPVGKKKSGRASTPLSCPLGARLIGLHGAHDHLVRSLGAVCVTSSGALIRTPPAGVAGGHPFELTCRAPRALVGVSARAGDLIDAAGIICSPP